MFPKRKTMFLSDVFEKCAKANSKTQVFFDQFFLSTRRATTRRVNITIVHIKRERIGKKSREKVKRINHFFEVFFWDRNKEIQDTFTKRRMICLNFPTKQNEFFLRGPKRRLIKENQEK